MKEVDIVSAPVPAADNRPRAAQSRFRRVPVSPRAYQLVFDAAALALSFVAYYLLRFKTGWFAASHDMVDAAFAEPEMFVAVAAVVAALVGYWILLFWFAGLYGNWYIRSPFDEYFTVVRITFVGCCFLAIAILLDDINTAQQNSRFVMFLYWADISACICAGRLLARLVQEALRARGVIAIPVVLVGGVAKLGELLELARRNPAFGYRTLGATLQNAEELDRWRREHADVPALGTFDRLAEVLDAFKPREALIAIESPDHEDMLRIGLECDARGVAMKIVPDLYEIFSGQARTTQIYGTPLIAVSQQLMKPWEAFVKRLMDIALSLAAIVVGIPAWVAVGVIIRLESPGKALYTQERVGKNGRRFMMYKFRSMRSDAEKDGPQWSHRNDARVTRVGRFIRKTHIDEVPQFWNILKGDMSLVGPRPERPFFVDKYTQEIPYYPRRLKVRPGLTGWYQVHFDVQEETVEYVKKRLAHDFFYIENMSFRLDVEILVRTVFRVLRGSGTA